MASMRDESEPPSDEDDELEVEGMSSNTPTLEGMGDPSHNSEHKRHARAQHNALERRRRDNIKDMYSSLKTEIANFPNDRKTIDQINDSEAEITQLEQEVKQLEEANAELKSKIAEKQRTQAQQRQQMENSASTSRDIGGTKR